MTKEEIIEMAEECVSHKTCENCKFSNFSDGETDCNTVLAKYIVDKENEPAPSGNDTSSKENKSQLNDTANLRICQEALEEIKESLLLIYEDMTNEEQRAWELGEIFNQTTNLLKSGDNK